MMYFTITFVMFLVSFRTVTANDSKNYEDDYNYLDIYDKNNSYFGEKFPEAYLSVDGIKPTTSDLTVYMENLMRTVNYFASKPNETDPNVSLGLYFTIVTLKRTLLDYEDKLEKQDKLEIKKLIRRAQYAISHFIYETRNIDETDYLLHHLSRIFTSEDAILHSIGQFHRDVPKKWIKSNLRLHEHIEEMDDMTLDRFTYAQLVTSMDDYYKTNDSDFCIASISFHPLPSKYVVKEPCRWDEYCIPRVFQMPSHAYTLSHRLIYILGLHLTRRCFILNEVVDALHMDIMCANMYREAVYLARRGFFYRDLFMEHSKGFIPLDQVFDDAIMDADIALCGLLGYEEFHRTKWFKKILTWIDEDGCMIENRNFELNRTRIYVANAKTRKKIKFVRRLKRKMMMEDCQHHQMALLMMVLAHAIRYTAYSM